LTSHPIIYQPALCFEKLLYYDYEMDT